MRGIYTPVTDIRRKVFTEVARMSYESNEMADYAKEIRDLPFKIMPGEDSSLRRKCIYRESHCRRASSTCDWTTKPYTR